MSLEKQTLCRKKELFECNTLQAPAVGGCARCKIYRRINCKMRRIGSALTGPRPPPHNRQGSRPPRVGGFPGSVAARSGGIAAPPPRSVGPRDDLARPVVAPAQKGRVRFPGTIVRHPEEERPDAEIELQLAAGGIGSRLLPGSCPAPDHEAWRAVRLQLEAIPRREAAGEARTEMAAEGAGAWIQLPVRPRRVEHTAPGFDAEAMRRRLVELHHAPGSGRETEADAFVHR